MNRTHILAMAAIAIVTVTIISTAYAETSSTPAVRTLTLGDAVALAETENPRIAGANADAALASAQAAEAAAAEQPGLSTNTFAATGSEGGLYTASPGVLPGNITALPSQTDIDQNLTLMIPLFTGGRLHDETLSARDLAGAGAQTGDATRAEVARDVALAYDQALLTGALVDVAQARVDAEDEQVRITSQRVAAGASASVDLAREQAEQADADSALASARSDAALAMVDLEIAIGEPPTQVLKLADTLDTLYASETPLPSSLDGAVATALSVRPEALAAATSVAAMQKAVGAVDGEYAPQVYGVAMADAADSSNAGDEMGPRGMQSKNAANAGYTVGITVSLPLIDGGQRRADHDAGIARLARARADEATVNQSIALDVASAWLALQSAAEQRTAALAGVAAADQAYSLANLRYNAGKSVLAERLDALSAATHAHGALATATAAVIDARIRLRWAVGNVAGR